MHERHTPCCILGASRVLTIQVTHVPKYCTYCSLQYVLYHMVTAGPVSLAPTLIAEDHLNPPTAPSLASMASLRSSEGPKEQFSRCKIATRHWCRARNEWLAGCAPSRSCAQERRCSMSRGVTAVNGKQGRRYLPMGRLFRDEVGILRGFDVCGEGAARVWRADEDCISVPSGFRCVTPGVVGTVG